jgi:hypothetical protein
MADLNYGHQRDRSAESMPLRIAGASGQATCFVCGTPIPFADAKLQNEHQDKVCRDFECQGMMRQKSMMSPKQFQSKLEFQRRMILERQDKRRSQRLHRERIKQLEDAENQQILQRELAGRPDLDGKQIALLMIPSGHAEAVPLTEDRVAEYRAHLEQVLDAAMQYKSVDEIPMDRHHADIEKLRKSEQFLQQYPPIQAFSDRACGICKGGCCSAGGQHAFISVVTLRRLLDALPELTRDDILNLYLQRLPAASVAGGCVNQKATGCALPRELRSDVCNGFYCDELYRIQRDMPEQSYRQVLVIRRANTQWNRFDSEDPNPVQEVLWVSVEDE